MDDIIFEKIAESKRGEIEEYMFYVLPSRDVRCVDTELNEGYSLEFWKPDIRSPVPKHLIYSSFLLRLCWHYFMYYFGFFRNSDYGVFVIHYGGKMIHRTVILPSSFKFPFARERDLFIDCCTAYDHQRKGIAFYVIQRILDLYKDQDRRFWYIVKEENTASIRLAEKSGFTFYGRGVRKKRLGIKAIDSFVLKKGHSQCLLSTKSEIR